MKTKTTRQEETTIPDESSITALQAENEQLKTTIRLNAAKEQITASLTKAGARSPGLLFDAAKGDLQFAEDGGLANSAAIVERLTREFPEQFGVERPASIDAGAGRVAAPALTKEALSRMSASEIAKLDWAEVRQVLSAP
ncbi:MAG: hypothetical protein KA956_14485 [Pyrinomonadaceae bacterium]|nr:hypothetical protein [Pyrinomonadaceae bacterium]